jgi:hypothetical protein
MKVRDLAFVTAAGMIAIVSQASAQSTTARSDETQMTAAGAIATDQHWSDAETHGDVAFLGQLMLPEYRSVGPDGVAHSRATIIGGAKKNIGNSAGVAAAAAYVKAHPYATAVVLEGNTAVLSFYDPQRGPEKGVRSSDILVYVDGRWHALYSQHANAG